MKQSGFPKGWDEDRVKRVLEHNENQTEDEAVERNEIRLWRIRILPGVPQN